jgi:hypothetical protein
MADAAFVEHAPQASDHVVRRGAGGLVDDEQTVHGESEDLRI